MAAARLPLLQGGDMQSAQQSLHTRISQSHAHTQQRTPRQLTWPQRGDDYDDTHTARRTCVSVSVQ